MACDARVEDTEARARWSAMGFPGDLPPGPRWRVETYEDMTGIDEKTGTGEVVAVVVFAARWVTPRSRKACVDLVCSTLTAAGALGLVRGTHYGESGGHTPDDTPVAWGEGTTPDGEPFLVRVDPRPAPMRGDGGGCTADDRPNEKKAPMRRRSEQ